MTYPSDTIAAIGTASGESGIAIVRVSGPDSLAVADRVCRVEGPPPSARNANTFLRCHVHSEDGEAGSPDLDEVILMIYRAPHSYTREDVVEIQGHGGRSCSRRILRAVVEAGARVAEPGEFTRRAFLNGRIDLLQAEAVADLVGARSDRAAAAAIEQLEGRLSSAFAGVYNKLLASATELEATLDFPEDELPESVAPGLVKQFEEVMRQLLELLKTWEEGHLLRDGARVVISGLPNVGKSTLLNSLLGNDRAIVSEIPGTTRDTIEEQLVLDGIPLRLIDTAGLRDSECPIEREGVVRAQARISSADVLLHVVDSSRELVPEDKASLGGLDPARTLVILNKQDLGARTSAKHFKPFKCIECSLLDPGATEPVKAGVSSILGRVTTGPPHAVISERHRSCVQSALNALNDSLSCLELGSAAAPELAASSLRVAIESLGTAIGRTYSDDLLDSIFSRFCIGK